MLVIGYFMLKGIANILRIPSRFMVPIVMVFCALGSFAMRNSMLDVVTMAVTGIVSYVLLKVGINPAPVSLGLMLGPIAEDALGITLVIAGAKGSVPDALIFRPICLVLILLSIASVFFPVVMAKIKERKRNGVHHA
jgi:putative tricarboxylic transport membrane protein